MDDDAGDGRIRSSEDIYDGNNRNARDIPIIAMTANGFTEDRRRVLEAGNE